MLTQFDHRSVESRKDSIL